jgi:hypothetical protein
MQKSCSIHRSNKQTGTARQDRRSKANVFQTGDFYAQIKCISYILVAENHHAITSLLLTTVYFYTSNREIQPSHYQLLFTVITYLLTGQNDTEEQCRIKIVTLSEG